MDTRSMQAGFTLFVMAGAAASLVFAVPWLWAAALCPALRMRVVR